MRFSTRVVWLLIAGCLSAAGCNQNRYATAQPPAGMPQQQPQYVSEADEMQRRATALDADNQDLHQQLAQSQQHVKLLEQHVNQLNRELQEKATEMQEMLAASQDSQQQLDALQASTQRRGGAIITANNSLHETLPQIVLAGVEVRREEDVIRLELSGDLLFQPGTSQLLPSSQHVLNQLSTAVRQYYPAQILGIEGHTDSRPLGTISNHQLSAEQAIAVFQVLVSRYQLPPQQLFTVGHGANHPRASNATPAGRAKNRRIELVVYPEKFSG